MRKDKTSSLKPPLNASCKLFHCSHTVVLYVGLPSSSQQRLQKKKKKTQLLQQMLYSWQVPPTQTLMSLERVDWRGQQAGVSTRSPPSQPAPARSLKPPSPRTSERRWRPDGTCSSSPRRLSSTVWFPAQVRGKRWPWMAWKVYMLSSTTAEYWLLSYSEFRNT